MCFVCGVCSEVWAWRSEDSSSSMWVLSIKLKWSSLKAGSLTGWAISATPNCHFHEKGRARHDSLLASAARLTCVHRAHSTVAITLKQFPESKAVFYYHLSIQRCWSTNPVVIGMGHRQLWSCPVSAGAWGAGFSVDAWTITCWHWPYTHLFNKTQQLLIIWFCHLRELL